MENCDIEKLKEERVIVTEQAGEVPQTSKKRRIQEREEEDEILLGKKKETIVVQDNLLSADLLTGLAELYDHSDPHKAEYKLGSLIRYSAPELMTFGEGLLLDTFSVALCKSLKMLNTLQAKAYLGFLIANYQSNIANAHLTKRKSKLRRILKKNMSKLSTILSN